MRRFLSSIICLIYSLHAWAAFELPNYANAPDITQVGQSKGKQITEFSMMVAGIVCILGILWGIIQAAVDDMEKGKQKAKWSFILLILAASVYSIAKLAV